MDDAATTRRLLERIGEGDSQAEAELLPRVYEELHRIAAHYVRAGRVGHTLQPTALVHEAYLKLAGGDKDWNCREHFVGVAAKAMRSVLVDHERSKRAAKRGGDRDRVSLDAIAALYADRVPDLLELDSALERLAELDPPAARVVELRFFAGLENEEVARCLGISERSVRRLWQVSRLWLRRELDPDG